jgi:CheY-like chemotaxis protein
MKHVLVVDDDFDICDSVQLLLEPRYKVLLAYNGAQALELIELRRVDAVVLDLMMPVMDGETFLRELRARNLSIPVIVASASNDLAARARSAGAVEWLQKPFSAEALLKALCNVTLQVG